jgi:hypothetical protein
VSLPRPVIHLAMLAAIAAGIWIGIGIYRFFAGA